MTLMTKFTRQISADALHALYKAVGWEAYTRAPELLQKGVENSSYVVSVWSGTLLIALARCVSDDATIMYLQDILVLPAYQRQGIGRSLVEKCLERFSHCRQIVLMTDDSASQLLFYESLGFSNTKNIYEGMLNTFVRIKD